MMQKFDSTIFYLAQVWMMKYSALYGEVGILET